MTKLFLIIGSLLFLLACLHPLRSQADTPAASAAAEAGQAGKPFKVVFKADFAISLVSNYYFAPAVTLAYQPGTFGPGIEFKYLTNLIQKDSYGALFGELHIGLFYIGVGGSWVITEPQAPESGFVLKSDSPINLAWTAGFNIPGFTLGPGKLGLNFSFDFITTANTYEIEGEDAALDVLGILLAPIYWMVDMGKVNVGLIYAIEM